MPKQPNFNPPAPAFGKKALADDDFGPNIGGGKTRRKPRGKPTAAQRAGYLLYHGKGGKKK